MKQNSTQTQVPTTGIVRDARTASGEAVDRVMLFMMSNSSETEKANQLMLFLHEIASQPPEMVIDYLEWAQTHCYQHTTDAMDAQDAHLARLLAEHTNNASA